MRNTCPKNSRNRKSRIFSSRVIFLALAAVALLTLTTTSALMAQLTGAIFTTTVSCPGTDQNIYASKGDVYLDGGPHNGSAAGLPDGYYYVQVTEPDGTLLGTSVGSGLSAPGGSDGQVVHVTGGEFDLCYRLSDIVKTAGPNCTNGDAGYCTTTNPGGEYKVWVSTVSTFDQDSSKTDNFKVAGGGTPPQGLLKVIKFYDTDTSGTFNAGDVEIVGWEVKVGDQAGFPGTAETKFTPVSIVEIGRGRAPQAARAQVVRSREWSPDRGSRGQRARARQVPGHGRADSGFLRAERAPVPARRR